MIRAERLTYPAPLTTPVRIVQFNLNFF